MELEGFTIEVKKKEKDEGFSFETLEMFHQECYSGKIKVNSCQKDFDNLSVGLEHLKFYELTCTRCGLKLLVKKQSEVPSKIIRTGIDGQKSEVVGFIMENADANRIDAKAANITVIQKS